MLEIIFEEFTIHITNQGIEYNNETIQLVYSKRIEKKLHNGEIYLHEDLEEEISGYNPLLHVIIGGMKYAKNNPNVNKSIVIGYEDLPQTGSSIEDFDFDKLFV